MFCSTDDFVLNNVAQLYKVSAVPGYPDDEISVMLWMFLRVNKYLFINNVKLDMLPTHAEVSFY